MELSQKLIGQENFFRNLITERLYILPLDTKFLDEFHSYSTNKKLYEHLEFEPFKNKKESEIYLNKLIKRSMDGNSFYYFIFLKDNEELIGSFGLRNYNYIRNSIEIGYGINPKHWGCGYFTEIGSSIMKELKKIKIKRVVAITASQNLASIKGLEKIGFSNEGELISYYRDQNNGNYFNAIMMSNIL